MDAGKEYKRKMKDLLSRKEVVLQELRTLIIKLRELEAEEEELSDNEFIRTGSVSFDLDIDIVITEYDLLKDLVNRTEGINIKLGPQNLN